MDGLETDVRGILESVAGGSMSVADARKRLAHLPFEDLGFARVDHHRAVRGAGPEAIYARSKTPQQVTAIATALLRHDTAPVLVTKAAESHARDVLAALPRAVWHERAGMIVLRRIDAGVPGTVTVLCAGTSDLPAAEEAVVTVEAFGCQAELIADVGVARPDRLIAETGRLQDTDVLIVVAGMETALPSLAGAVYGGPILAVPTSAGYGATFDGLAALLGMLNSCALGVSVVNIDNGFGAGVVAARILAGSAARHVGSAPARSTAC